MPPESARRDVVSETPVRSPCVSICVLDPAGTNVCTGCGRTLDEVAAWSQLSNAERREVVARCPARLAALRARDARPPANDDAPR
jgi:predicted Fe-S protein YdhL (DUF1289 family)